MAKINNQQSTINNPKTPYKGIIRISCNKKCDKKPEPLLQPDATCIACNRAKLEILDLEGKVIAEGSSVSSGQGSVVRKRNREQPITNNR